MSSSHVQDRIAKLPVKLAPAGRSAAFLPRRRRLLVYCRPGNLHLLTPGTVHQPIPLEGKVSSDHCTNLDSTVQQFVLHPRICICICICICNVQNGLVYVSWSMAP